MRTLKEYADKMREYSSLPSNLSALLLEAAADYGEAMNDRIALEVERADFWIKNKNIKGEKPISDKTVEAMFLKEGSGKRLRNCELYLKGLSSLMSAMKSHLRNLQEEAKNNI